MFTSRSLLLIIPQERSHLPLTQTGVEHLLTHIQGEDSRSEERFLGQLNSSTHVTNKSFDLRGKSCDISRGIGIDLVFDLVDLRKVKRTLYLGVYYRLRNSLQNILIAEETLEVVGGEVMSPISGSNNELSHLDRVHLRRIYISIPHIGGGRGEESVDVIGKDHRGDLGVLSL